MFLRVVASVEAESSQKLILALFQRRERRGWSEEKTRQTLNLSDRTAAALKSMRTRSR